MNKSGKTLTIFVVVIAILLVSLSVIAVFFFLQEVELRRSAEYNLEQMRVRESKLHQDLESAKKQLFLFEEKSKESDEKIESLLEDVELEQGLREEIKKDYRELKEVYDKEVSERENLEQELEAANQAKDGIEEELNETKDKFQELQQKFENVESQSGLIMGEVSPTISPYSADNESDESQVEENISEDSQDEGVELEKIVVNPPSDQSGEIISIDEETNFFIVDLGEKDGIRNGAVLSLYRGDNYLGDAKVTRVLPEMSAADFIPPLDSKKIQKSDKVFIKE